MAISLSAGECDQPVGEGHRIPLDEARLRLLPALPSSGSGCDQRTTVEFEFCPTTTSERIAAVRRS
jgi:hypothetical protein